jgi:ESX secretion system protein EccE
MTTDTQRTTLDERLAGHEAAVPPLPALRALPSGRRRLTGPVLGQLVAVELAAFAVLVASGRQSWLLPVVAVPAAATVALLLGRWRGRWWYQQLTLRWRYWRAQRATVRAGGEPDPRRAALRDLVPELSVADVTDRDGGFGIGYDGAGWFAALEVTGGDAALPLRALAGLVDGRMTRLAVVTHAVPSAVPRLNTWAPAAASYVDVSAKLTGPVPPGEAHTYLVVRLDAGDAARVSGRRGGGTVGVRRALAAALRRAARTLSTVDISYRQLSGDELCTALAASLGFGPVPTIPAGQRRTAVRWDQLSADGYPQVCYQIVGWPRYGDRFAAALDGLPAAATDLAILLGPPTDRVTDTEIPLRGYLRVAAVPGAIGAVCDAVVAGAGLQGITLRRLDGEHAAAAYSTAPTGGLAAVGAPGHACPLPALDALAAPAPRGGVLLGRDPDHRPVLVPVFADRPRRLVVVGSVWPARIVLLRCLAAGARIVASAGQPDWVSLGRWATGADHWVAPPGSPAPPPHPAAPVLVGRDPAQAGDPGPQPAGWQTLVATCARPTAALLTGADLVVTGRLTAADAGLVAATYGLDGEAKRLLAQLYDDMIAIIQPGHVQYAWPTPSAAEREILTPPSPQPSIGAPPR